jgi:hypothetical protein
VGGMRKKDMVRLLGIDQPGDVFIFFFQFFSQLDKIGLFFGISLRGGMALQTFVQAGNTGKPTIIPQEMTFGALQSSPFPMLKMAEENRLLLPRMDQRRKDQPTHN